MITCKVDTSRLKRRLAAQASACPKAARALVMEAAGGVMRTVCATSHRDTNRYVRGWAQAANAAGLGFFPVPPLNKAARHDRILRALRQQLRRWEYYVARYEKQGRTGDKWYRQAVRKRDKARLHLERFADTQDGAVIAVNLYGNPRFEGGMTTVRHRVYGGTGRVYDAAGRALVELHNREPHVSIVESRFHILRDAQARYRGLVTRYGKTYVKKLREAAGAA